MAAAKKAPPRNPFADPIAKLAPNSTNPDTSVAMPKTTGGWNQIGSVVKKTVKAVTPSNPERVASAKTAVKRAKPKLQPVGPPKSAPKPLPLVVSAGTVNAPAPPRAVPTPRSAPTDTPRPTHYSRGSTSVDAGTVATPPTPTPKPKKTGGYSPFVTDFPTKGAPKKTNVKINPGDVVYAGTVNDTPPATSTTDPITDWVNAAQLPQMQAIRNAQAASELAAKNAATTTTGYYGALADTLKGIGPATQAGYSSAAASDSAFGKGFSDGLAHIQGQAQTEAGNILGASGGEGQAGQVNQAIGGSNATDALYGVGGYLPATTMNREGAAFGAAANRLPATMGGLGANEIERIGMQQRTDQQGFAKQFSDLAAQVPGLRLQYGNQLATQNLAVQTRQDKLDAQAQHEADVRRQQALTYILYTGRDANGNLTPKAQIEIARLTGEINGQPTLAARVAQVNADNAATRLSLATQKTLSDLYGVDAHGNLTLAGKKAALAEWKVTHPGQKGAYTKNQLGQRQLKAGQEGKLLALGKQVHHYDATTGQWVTSPDSISGIANYQDALKQMIADGYALSEAQTALAPFYPAGQTQKLEPDPDNPGQMRDSRPYGRPYLDVNGRDILAQAGLPLKHNLDPPTPAQVAILHLHHFEYTGPQAAP